MFFFKHAWPLDNLFLGFDVGCYMFFPRNVLATRPVDRTEHDGQEIHRGVHDRRIFLRDIPKDFFLNILEIPVY